MILKPSFIITNTRASLLTSRNTRIFSCRCHSALHIHKHFKNNWRKKIFKIPFFVGSVWIQLWCVIMSTSTVSTQQEVTNHHLCRDAPAGRLGPGAAMTTIESISNHNLTLSIQVLLCNTSDGTVHHQSVWHDVRQVEASAGRVCGGPASLMWLCIRIQTTKRRTPRRPWIHTPSQEIEMYFGLTQSS